MDFVFEPNRIYSVNGEGRVIAEIAFPTMEDGVANIDHTFVDSSLRGQGVASQLMKTAIEYLKKDHRKIRASCSYAVDWFAQHPEYSEYTEDSEIIDR